LEQSRDLAEVASIRDMVLAAETYARAQRLADEAVHYATEVRVRATRKAGELLGSIELPARCHARDSPPTRTALGPPQGSSASERGAGAVDHPSSVR